MPSGKNAHHPGWKPLQGSANDRIPGWAPSPCRLPGPVPRYVQVYPSGFHRRDRNKHPLPSARKGVRGKACGAVLGSERLGVCSFKVLLWASLFSKACACVWAHVCGRVLGAGAFQTQSWLSWFLLQSRAGGYGAGVHGRSRFWGSACLWVTAVRRRGRPAKPVRRVSCRPYAFCALPLARPCPRRRQRRCSGRPVRRLPLPAARRRHHRRHLPA